MPAADLQELEARLGYTFRDRSLLVRALTHKSYSFEQKVADPSSLDNEQLEFLGDAILGFLISEYLVLRNSAWAEGRLSKVKAQLVSANHLHRVAQRLSLGDFLHLGRSEEKGGGRQKKMLLANAVEALIAALHIDGGLEVARRFVADNIEEAPQEIQVTDYKGSLQERTDANRLPKPHYVTVQELGPGHSKTFIVEARVGEVYRRQGTGFSKKSAAQHAAKAILDDMDLAGAERSVGKNPEEDTSAAMGVA